jgi:hypothetical protein
MALPVKGHHIEKNEMSDIHMQQMIIPINSLNVTNYGDNLMIIKGVLFMHKCAGKKKCTI